MEFSHKKLDVYQVSLEYVQWAYVQAGALKGVNRHARDQLIRASQSIPLNIAEGNGKFSDADRARFFGIARGSALECAAIQDVLVIGEGITREVHESGEALLYRIVSMLTRMTENSWRAREGASEYLIDTSPS